MGPAVEALRKAIVYGDPDDALSVKAACAVLDRTGFGTHSTIAIDDNAADLSNLTPEQLKRRLAKVAAAIAHQSPSTGAGSANPDGANAVLSFPTSKDSSVH